MKARWKSRDGDEALAFDSEAETGERVSAISRLISDQFDHLEPQLANLLDDADGLLRGAALYGLLGRWRIGKYQDRAQRFLISDASESVRERAAIALGEFGQHLDDDKKRDRIARLLLNRMRTDSDPWVQEACYRGLKTLGGASLATRFAPSASTRFDLDTDVDWIWLRERFPRIEI